ncbi:MAG: GNAT family N-acetyltransferase [Bacteroides sp.]|nr:GNAT family N-acetyltransferase [Bacteroides sp.]MCM1388944.1 GNAT family N-acetyltransferase [Bacteroides sp.]
MSIEFRSLSATSMENIIEAFQKAFGDYAVKFESREIQSMLRRRGFRKDISFAAFDGDEICSFLLNGYGVYAGESCCYDCGTGTLPLYRGMGLAGKLFQVSLPELRNAGVENYILESLISNETAVNIYRKNGFEIVATYNCYNQSIDNLRLSPGLSVDVSIERIGADALRGMTEFCDFVPSWQNSIESIERAADELIILSALHEGKRIGYCVYDAYSGDIAQIAVDKSFRRRGVGRFLLYSAIQMSESGRVKILNIDAGCQSLSGFVEALGFDKGLSQYGMMKKIDVANGDE